MEAISANEAVKKILAEQGLGITVLGKRVGISTAAAWDRLNHNNITTKRLYEMLTALDYEIIVQPRGKRLVEGAMVIK